MDDLDAITGLLAGLAIWAYAFSEWGCLIGLAVGRVPALIGGLVAVALRPLLKWLLLALLVLAAFARLD
jgi:hypothetical protein